MSLIVPPRTAAAKAAHELLHGSCDEQLIGHSERSFQFAALLASAEPGKVDLEVLYVGTILHDVGLAPRFAGPERFDVRGANVARSLLASMPMARRRVENVWDVIALHAASAVAAHKSTETRLANRGISIDVRGAGHEDIPADDLRAVLDAWPRDEFPDAFEVQLIEEVRANPSTVRLSWMECIAAKHVHGYQPADFLETLQASRHFC